MSTLEQSHVGAIRCLVTGQINKFSLNCDLSPVSPHPQKRRDPLVSIPTPMRQYADHDNAKKRTVCPNMLYIPLPSMLPPRMYSSRLCHLFNSSRSTWPITFPLCVFNVVILLSCLSRTWYISRISFSASNTSCS